LLDVLLSVDEMFTSLFLSFKAYVFELVLFFEGNPLGPIIWLEKSSIFGSKLFSFYVIVYALFAFFLVDPFLADFSSSVLEFDRTYLDIKT